MVLTESGSNILNSDSDMKGILLLDLDFPSFIGEGADKWDTGEAGKKCHGALKGNEGTSHGQCTKNSTTHYYPRMKRSILLRNMPMVTSLSASRTNLSMTLLTKQLYKQT